MKLDRSSADIRREVHSIWSFTKSVNGKPFIRDSVCEPEQIRVVTRVLAIANGALKSDEAPIALVIGSSKSKIRASEARDLGASLAASGWVLVTGGRGGYMEEVSLGYTSSSGRLAFGILPHGKKPVLVKNVIYIQTALGGADPLGLCSRNHANVILADRVLCMPGESGTIAESVLARELYKRQVRCWPACNPPADAMEQAWLAQVQAPPPPPLLFLTGIEDPFLKPGETVSC